MKNNHPSLLLSVRLSLVCVAATFTVLSFVSCEVKKTQDAKAPEVDVKVKEGQMPKYDVDPAKVTIEGEKKEITVPKVTTEQKTVTVPDVDVTMPSEETPAPTPVPTP